MKRLCWTKAWSRSGSPTREAALPRKIIPRLFQPFVTTKPTGMGVGLSISKRIIEAHGGEMWAEPNPGGGTLFRFTLESDMRREHAG